MISQERYIISKHLSRDGFAQKKAAGFRLLNLIMDWDDDKVFGFGTEQANNELRLLSFDIPTRGQELRIQTFAKLAKMSRKTKYAASVVRTDDQNESRIVVATTTGRIYEISPPRHD